MKELYIGVMSGTSLDGIDISLCEIDNNSCKLISKQEYAYDRALKEEVLHAINASITLKEIGILDHRLGKMFADAVNSFLTNNKIDSTKITAIGLHGQTLWHEPNGEYPFSMQLGDANIVAVQTNISVVADFRRKDIANGGQGAPFAPAFHKFIFGSQKHKAAVLNIGGMANITILDDTLMGFDTGVGNVLMDYWIDKHQNKPYDKDGEWAKSGEADELLVKVMLSHPYFAKKPPKSTGRELFNKKWLHNKLCKFPVMKSEDVQATLLELTVLSAANEVKKNSIEQVIVCGGGAENTYLMQRLQEELQGVVVSSSNEHGIDSDIMESMAFAWLAYKRIHKQSVELSSVTGAKKDSILGGIYA